MEPMIFIVLVVITLGFFLWPLMIFNRFVRLRNHCREAWSNIDTELKRRYDLIPNLVRTVQGYAAHEKQLLEEVTRHREACRRNEGTPRQQAASENAFIDSLNRLLVRVEAYPDLKASKSFLELQGELANTEDRLQAARRFFNGNIREHNIAVESFPSNLVAGAFGFAVQDFFEIADAQVRHAPKVSVTP